MMKQTVFVVFEKDDPKDRVVGGRLTLDAAISLCKLAKDRYWTKVVATKQVGASQFDIAKQ